MFPPQLRRPCFPQPQTPNPNPTRPVRQCYLDVTAAATALLRREAAVAAQQRPVAPPDLEAGGAPGGPPPPPPVPPGSFEGWHVAGAGGAGGGAGADGGEAAAGGGAAAWWARPAGEWSQDERLLAAGGRVVAGLREAVERRLGFTCSAGLAHFKVLAKLASGLHKPRQQTLVPASR
jgi:nucleotidyltransferase/DNA polymerase involved in DNA repair